MKVILEPNVINHLKKDDIIFIKNDKVKYMGFIIKGSIQIESDGILLTAKSGDMVGIIDIFANAYLSNYKVGEDTMFYAFPACDTNSIESFLNSNKDYRGIMIDSLSRELMQYLNDFEYLINLAKELFLFLKKHYEIAVKEGMREKIPTEFIDTLPEDILKIDYDENKINFYKECAKIPIEVKKKYYYGSEFMAIYQAEDISFIIREIKQACLETIKYIKDAFSFYIDENGEGLFNIEVRFAKETKKTGRFQMEQFLRISDTKQKILDIGKEIQRRTGEQLYYDINYMDEQINIVMNAPVEDVMDDTENKRSMTINPIELLKNSLQQILDFSEISKEEQECMIKFIGDFTKLSDRFSTADDVRTLKKNITKEYFKIYKKCLYQWFENKNVPLPIKMFLNYGYIDEHLLDQEQLLFLCDMVNEKEESLPFRIYRMPEWLEDIYEGKKETSRNEFERDYRDELREEKRVGKITEQEEKELLSDKERRVNFEIDNMFVNNNKIVNARLSTYVPILYKDQFYGDIQRLYLTKKQIRDEILELEKKDYTIFYREVFYRNTDMKIEKEYLMKHVYPDIIISPIYGTTSSMWQEITGKKRDSAARFIFPTLCEGDIQKPVTKAFGRFHWEYCRCVQGTSWNNIQYKSLTSEYMDYIQYYRRNHDLSEEKREKIRSQIQKARNNTREVFLDDYEVWIYSESKSALKLNKVSREILATYCPFSKEIRENLKTNAAFADAMFRHQRNFQEKSHEWELRIRRRENNNLEIPEEYHETYDFYTNK